ncbi:MAG: GNVR domain-containing protein [bacterium]
MKSLQIPDRFRDLDISSHELSIEFILALLIERWKFIGIIALGIAFMTAVISLFIPNLYTSGVSLYPTSSPPGGLENLTGIAANLGFNFPMSGKQSFNIPEVLQSYSVMSRMVRHKWENSKFGEPVDMITYWEYNDTTGSNSLVFRERLRSLLLGSDKGKGGINLIALRQEELAIQRLRNRISTHEDKNTGQIHVTVLMEERGLSADVANYLYDAVAEITTRMNNSLERKNREFIEGRIVQVDEDLAQAEDELTQFKESNRSITGSPQLELERDRLMRNVRIQTEIYLTLRQQYELSRIEEVRQSQPVVVLDRAKISALKSKPHRRRMVLIALFLGALAGSTWVLALSFWKSPSDFLRPLDVGA